MVTKLSGPLGLCSLLLTPLVSPGGVTVSPGYIDVNFRDEVQVIADVPPGDDASLDLIVDFNGNGQMDGPDLIWQHYDVRDGEPVLPAGSPRVADTDGLANGQIRCPLGSFMGPYERFPAGQYIVRVSSSAAA